MLKGTRPFFNIMRFFEGNFWVLFVLSNVTSVLGVGFNSRKLIKKGEAFKREELGRLTGSFTSKALSSYFRHSKNEKKIKI